MHYHQPNSMVVRWNTNVSRYPSIYGGPPRKALPPALVYYDPPRKKKGHLPWWCILAMILVILGAIGMAIGLAIWLKGTRMAPNPGTCESSNPCQNGGKCYVGSGNLTMCDCSGTGWTGGMCQTPEDVCAGFGPCQYGGVCYSAAGNPRCDCSGTGYTGEFCQTRVDVCASYSACQNGGRCFNSAGSPKCDCTSTGFTGEYCQIPPVDHCEDGTHNCWSRQYCKYVWPDQFTCSCPAGTIPHTDGHTCIDINECSSNPCTNNGTCFNGLNFYWCGCGLTGFAGPNCSTDVDECDTGTHQCISKSNCQNTVGSYTCTCPDGWTMDPDGKTCNDVDECVTSPPCVNNGQCRNTVGSYFCNCTNTGYTGSTCSEDVQECDGGIAKCTRFCTNTIGSYTCSCRADETLQSDGYTCA